MLSVCAGARAGRADAAPGETCAGASKAAQELERAGKLLAAREALAPCLSSTCPGAVRDECQRHLGAIEAAIPAVLPAAKDEGSNDIPSVRITIDGRPLGAARASDDAIPVDPGTHRLAFDAVGFRRVETTFVALEGNKRMHVVVFLNRAGPDIPRAARPFAGPEAASPGMDLTTRVPPTAPTPADSSATPLPVWLPWALAGATLALGGAAAIAGQSASHRYDDLRLSCGQTPQGCASDQIDDVKSRADRANLLWALAGTAGLGAGVTGFLNVRAAGVSGLWRF